MARREQFYGNLIIWTAFTTISGFAFLSGAFTGRDTVLLSLIVIVALASVMATRAIWNVNAGGRTETHTTAAIQRSKSDYFPRERVERLIATLDENQLDELARRLVFFDGSPYELDVIVREYEA